MHTEEFNDLFLKPLTEQLTTYSDSSFQNLLVESIDEALQRCS